MFFDLLSQDPCNDRSDNWAVRRVRDNDLVQFKRRKEEKKRSSKATKKQQPHSNRFSVGMEARERGGSGVQVKALGRGRKKEKKKKKKKKRKRG